MFYSMSIDSCNWNMSILSYCIINLYLCYYITSFIDQLITVLASILTIRKLYLVALCEALLGGFYPEKGAIQI